MKRFISCILCTMVVFTTIFCLGQTTKAAQTCNIYIDDDVYTCCVGETITVKKYMYAVMAMEMWNTDGRASGIEFEVSVSDGLKFKKDISDDSFPTLTDGLLTYNKINNRVLVAYSSINGAPFDSETSTLYSLVLSPQTAGNHYIKTNIKFMSALCYDKDEPIIDINKGISSKSVEYYSDIKCEFPNHISATRYDGKVKIYWDKVSSAYSYKVYYKKTGNYKYITTTSNTSIIDTATLGDSYYYAIRCLDRNGNFISDYIPSSKYTHYVMTPEITSINVGVNKVKLNWTKVEGVKNYRLFWRYKGETSFRKCVDTTATSYTDTGFKNGREYEYAVRCLSNDSSKFISDYNHGGYRFMYLDPPKNIKVSAITQQGKIKITWDKNEYASGYRVYYKRTDRDSSWRVLTDIKENVNTFTDYGCQNGKTYMYTVRCLNSYGGLISGYNDSASIKYYKIPDGLSAVKYNDNGRIKVSWNFIPGAKSYKIYYKREGWTSWKTSGTSTTNGFVDKGCSKGVTYIYTVRACDSKGNLISSYDPNGVRIKYN